MSVNRFLDMVWQYQIPTIVMLTCPVEDGKVSLSFSQIRIIFSSLFEGEM